jgi:D-3-phosphoglycerate dehydrogenase
MDELLGNADVVSLHVPEIPSTANMMGAEQFAKMKAGSIFINAARGTCVDIDALAAALESKHLVVRRLTYSLKSQKQR